MFVLNSLNHKFFVVNIVKDSSELMNKSEVLLVASALFMMKDEDISERYQITLNFES